LLAKVEKRSSKQKRTANTNHKEGVFSSTAQHQQAINSKVVAICADQLPAGN